MPKYNGVQTVMAMSGMITMVIGLGMSVVLIQFQSGQKRDPIYNAARILLVVGTIGMFMFTISFILN